jgi:hypothetical protein
MKNIENYDKVWELVMSYEEELNEMINQTEGEVPTAETVREYNRIQGKIDALYNQYGLAQDVN